MHKPIKYEQLQPEDRMTIASMKQQGRSVRAMARTLRRAPSTICRELARNMPADLAYGSHRAEQSCQARRRGARPGAKLHTDGLAWGVVLTLLDWRWSPQQIAGTLKRIFPNEVARNVSHETIYTAIYAHSPEASCAASSSPVCARAAARGCPARAESTGAARFPRW